jgi:hypothetical protein
MAIAPVLDPSHNVIEVDAPVSACILDGCGGMVVRHSLGGAQAVYRCSRCFRRYQVRAGIAGEAAQTQGRFRRFLSDFVSWRDD